MSKILLNGLHYEKNGAGISRYNEMLLKTFIEEKYDIDILLRKELKEKFNSENIIFADKNINSSKNRIIYEQWSSKDLYKKYELIHFPDYATPLFCTSKRIATIHDMAMCTMRSKRTMIQNLTKNILLKETIKNSDRLICVSEFAKKELLEYYPKVENKIRVIYEGINIPDIDISEEYNERILNKFNIKDCKYILYVGTIAPHKNIINLIKAFDYIKQSIPEYKLVIVGKKGWMYNEIFNEVDRLKLNERVIFTGFIDDLELEVLYKNTRLFTTVSLYEGFGFPPLEAMARKVPVVVSNIPVFKEVCGDCVEYCNPYEIEDISMKFEKILKNKTLSEYLRKKGYERVKKFNWKSTAKDTYEVYMEML